MLFVDRLLQSQPDFLKLAIDLGPAGGLLCREVLITAALEVFDPARHPLIDDATPSDTDARRMLEAIFGFELRGSQNDEARAHAKAAVRLALALQQQARPTSALLRCAPKERFLL